jgi:hypothetical protein
MKTSVAALLLVCAFPNIDANAASAGRLWTYQYVLSTATSDRELAPITEHIIKEDELHEPALLDYVAEVLSTRFLDAHYSADYKLRLVRALKVEKTPRYATVLEQVIAQSPQEAVRKEARDSLVKNKAGQGGYVPGTIDLHAVVAEMDAAALAAKPTTEQARHLAQFPGGTIDDLFAWAGKPQQIVSGQTRATDGLLINIKIQRLSFYYRGLGRVVFGYSGGRVRDEIGWLFQAVVADPLAFEQEFSYRDRAAELGLPDSGALEMTQLVSGYTAAMKNVVETNYRRAARPLEFMDTAAEILATQFKAAGDAGSVDTYAWICRLLTQHGGQRYAAILQRVAAETPDPKLRKYAELPIEKTTEVPADPYVPGTISLAAQRVKYPSPYPESTFQSGRL